jgi:propionate CoA-transferase
VKNKVMGGSEAAQLIKDGDTIAITSASMVGYPDYVIKRLEERYLETKHPCGLTLYAGCGHGNPLGYGADNRFGHPGFLKRTVCTHPDVVPHVRKLIEDGEIECYVFPQGVVHQLYRASAAKQPGILTKIGIGTYIDPRQDGGKLNNATTEELVELMLIDGEEYLFFRSRPINVAVIRGTSADGRGNVTVEEEALKLELLEVALAAKASGGKVIAQVKQVVANGSLKAKEVIVPGELIDAVVVCEEPDQHHRQTAGTIYSPFMSGELKCNPDAVAKPKAVLTAEDIVCRRALYEIYPGAVINVGVGIGVGVGPAATIEGVVNDVTFTLELGVFGGTPQAKADFGAAVNATSYIAHPSMFDFYHGGGLDIAFLGAAEIDAEGNVNVSRFGGRAAGQGGFIDISQTSKKVVFCTYFMAKDFESSIEGGKLVIKNEGKVPKFVDKVDQITFNGKLSRDKGQEVVVCTERAVFRLVKEGVMLTEIAPGVDLEKDILGNMGFKPMISDALKIMDSRIFNPGRMGCFDQ